MFCRRNLALSAIFIVFVLVQVCLAAISIDNAGSVSSDQGTGTTQTISSFTVASHSDKILIGGHGMDSNSDLTAFTFNGDTLTAITGAEIQHGGFSTAGLWYRLEPDVATGDIVATHSGGGINSGVMGISLYGVSQMSPIRDSDETSSTGTSDVLTLTTVAGDYVIYCLHAFASGSDPGTLVHTAGSATGEVEIGEVSTIADNQLRFACAYVVAVGASTEVGYSHATSSANAFVAIAVAPAASASRDMSLIGVGR